MSRKFRRLNDLKFRIEQLESLVESYKGLYYESLEKVQSLEKDKGLLKEALLRKESSSSKE
jgi:hypothetical protein